MRSIPAALVAALLAAPRTVGAFAPHSSTSTHARTKQPQLPPGYSSLRRTDAFFDPHSRHTTTLHATSPLSTLFASPLGAVLVLGTIVLIHESGHYLAARRFGIQVEEFSVGVGPKLFGFTALGNEFNLRSLPLGGYVRFPEHYNVTLVQEQQRKTYELVQAARRERNDGMAFQVLNALTLGYWEDRRNRNEREAILQDNSDFEALPWWKKVGRKKKELPADLVVDDVEIDYYDSPNLLQNRPWQERAVVLSGGVIFNLLLSFLIYFGEISYGGGLPKPIFDSGVIVSQAPRPEAAASGVLSKGDVILSINGSPLTLSTSPSAIESQTAINEFIGKIRNTPEGESLRLSVRHPKETTPVEVSITPKRSSTDAPPTIGVLLSPNFVKSEVLRSSDWVEASSMAAQYTAQMTTDTACGLISAFGSMLSPKSNVGAQVSGPIGLIRTGSEVVATQDWTAVFLFAAAISINLGVVNALPLPALDGGQLLFVLSEALTGRKVDQRVQEGITGAALFFLLALSVSAAVGDIGSIVSGN